MRGIFFPILFCWLTGFGQSAHLERKVGRLVDADSILLAGLYVSGNGDVLILQLRRLGMQVAVGGGWVVAVMRKGPGPEVECQVGFDSSVRGLPVAWMIGIARVMVAMKQRWKGTLVMVGGRIHGEDIRGSGEIIPYCVKSGACGLLQTFNKPNFATRSAASGLSLGRVFPASGTVGKTGFGR
jgi:hypothetical protein